MGAPHCATAVSRSELNRVESPREVCDRCARPPEVCLCSALPKAPIVTQTRVLVLQHPAEAKKGIASVPLIQMCLEHTTIVSGKYFNPNMTEFNSALEEGYVPLLLFPGPEAELLDRGVDSSAPKAVSRRWENEVFGPDKANSKKILLVLVDGTWTQARHMIRHSTELLEATTQVMFSASAESTFDALRKEPEKHCMSTLEACARSLRILERTAAAGLAADYMEATLERLVEIQLECSRTKAPRFNPRKRKTWNRKLHNKDQDD